MKRRGSDRHAPPSPRLCPPDLGTVRSEPVIYSWATLEKGQRVETEYGPGVITSFWPVRNRIMVAVDCHDRLSKQNAVRPIAFMPRELFGEAGWLDKQSDDETELARPPAV